MINKKLLILVAFSLFAKYLTAQGNFRKGHAGTWVNIGYSTLSGGKDAKLKEYISPQFLHFDSLGNCTIQIRSEHKLLIGKPINSRNFGSSIQYTYSMNKKRLTVSTINDYGEMIFVSYNEVSAGLLFKRYK